MPTYGRDDSITRCVACTRLATSRNIITAALTGFERLCERLWVERVCVAVGVVPPLPPVECKLQFLGVEAPDAINLPCALTEQSRGPFPSRPEPGRQRPGALHSSLRLTASSYRLHGCPLHCRSSAHAGQQGARHQFG